jgi:hypothetical protein
VGRGREKEGEARLCNGEKKKTWSLGLEGQGAAAAEAVIPRLGNSGE